MAHTIAEAAGPTREATSEGWLEALRANGSDREQAMEHLHSLLLRAARYEVGRRVTASAWLESEREELAQQSADDALVAILDKLDDFRGASRFTTWAYKFALLEAATRTRRRAWHDRQIPLEGDTWQLIADESAGPDGEAETNELLRALRDAIDQELTPHQRQILIAIVFHDVPIDVLAERTATTRGALYKTLHDARRKLRRRLVANGFGEQMPARRG
jgi:RNA polymerase sigma-70 factor (ECF subfamily)